MRRWNHVTRIEVSDMGISQYWKLVSCLMNGQIPLQVSERVSTQPIIESEFVLDLE
jgi:hypothetical protein